MIFSYRNVNGRITYKMVDSKEIKGTELVLKTGAELI
jgi:hypothetical protein